MMPFLKASRAFQIQSTTAPAFAQWLDFPNAGIPRTTDGKPDLSVPTPRRPDGMGYSIGKWEGDDFAVETAGVNDRFWMDNNGHPHTEALHLTERFRRKDF